MRIQALNLNSQPPAPPRKPSPPILTLSSLSRAYFPYRGLPYSFLIHVLSFYGLSFIPIFPRFDPVPKPSEKIVMIDLDDPLDLMNLPDIFGGGVGAAGEEAGPPGKGGGGSGPAGPTAPGRAPVRGFSYPGPKTVVSDFPEPTNRIQTLLQPGIDKLPTVNPPFSLPNFVQLAPMEPIPGSAETAPPEEDLLGQPPVPEPPVLPPQAIAESAPGAMPPPEPAIQPAAKVEVAQAELPKAELPKPVPAKVEPLKTEPLKPEPRKVDPPKQTMLITEPVKVEPPRPEPAKAEPLKPEPRKMETVTPPPPKSASSKPVSAKAEPKPAATKPAKAVPPKPAPVPAAKPTKLTKAEHPAPLAKATEVPLEGPPVPLDLPAVDKRNILALSPMPAPRGQELSVPDGEARGQFVISPQPNLSPSETEPGFSGGVPADPAVPRRLVPPLPTGEAAKATATGSGGGNGAGKAIAADSAGTGSGSGPAKGTMPGSAGAGSGSGTGIGPGNGAGSGAGSASGIGTGNGAGSGSGGGSGTGPVQASGAAVNLGQKPGSGAASIPAPGSNPSPATGSGSGAGPGSGSGYGPVSGIKPFSGITVVGGVPPAATASGSRAVPPASVPARAPRPLQTAYGLSIISTEKSGGGLPSFGVFSNEQIYTVYLDMRRTEYDAPRSWTLEFAVIQGTTVHPGEPSSAKAGQGGLVLPFPAVKEQPPLPAELVRRYLRRMLIVFAVINPQGKMEQLSIKDSPDPALNEIVLRSLSKWSFRPALLEGQPVSIKALIGIPLVLPE